MTSVCFVPAGPPGGSRGRSSMSAAWSRRTKSWSPITSNVGGGHRADLVVGPAGPIVDDRLHPLEEREEVVWVGRHRLVGGLPGRGRSPRGRPARRRPPGPRARFTGAIEEKTQASFGRSGERSARRFVARIGTTEERLELKARRGSDHIPDRRGRGDRFSGQRHGDEVRQVPQRVVEVVLPERRELEVLAHLGWDR